MGLGLAILFLTPCVGTVLAFVFFRESWRMWKQDHKIQTVVFFFLAIACAVPALWMSSFFLEAIQFLRSSF